jgi:hypothetical protein
LDLTALAQSIAGADDDAFWFWTVALLLGGVALFAFGFSRIRRARLLEDLPASKVRSAAQGYVELHGHARFLPGPEIQSPLSGSRCCWWEYRIEKRVMDGNGKRNRWQTIDSGTSDDLFLLADDTGECVVDPDGASVIPDLSRRWQGYHPRPNTFPAKSPWFTIGNYRYTEKMITYGSWLYSVGQFRSQTAFRADDESRDVAELLGDWKRDQRDLLRRFDANRDGKIDLDEWEAVRRAALEHVQAEQVERSVQPDLHVLARAADGRPFILSTLSEEQLSRDYRRWGGASVFAGVAAVGAGIFALLARGLLP